jgi:hypothetical protein
MERLGDDARRLLAASGVPDPGPLTTIADAWPSLVGEAIAKSAWPRRLARDGTLHVATTSSAWAFELGQLAPEILGRLSSLGERAPKALRFAPGPVPEPASSGPSEAAAGPPQIDPDDRLLAARLADPIADPELRELVSRAAAASLARARADRTFC